ncbi:DUF4326 domain-containing protein [Psychrosphaera sp. 1_MG-2023]|uniref:DUF4326 domain-containing protein n=1 Tax=Psychrosphaera sp. 1_MG-2023 TaxID=3062643 RepID=UPI0026E30388|nr:DUF4326 domain-containing protein [Psychrosphaera sp. 1_MG-2023]MDO6718683.1 DUF4326 domain-containing protein [Psychrosphaera sp. 1_MG-2023]
MQKITSNLGEVEIVFSDDPNQFIQKICAESSSQIVSNKVDTWTVDSITHAIIFDDGEEFSEETKLLTLNDKPIRLIRIKLTRVINIKRETKYQSEKSTPSYEYIGRGSYWGNPYSMFEEGEDREEVIRKYKYDFDFEKFPKKEKKEVFKLAGKRLGCFCKPDNCHGDVLADFLNQWDDNK